MMQVYDTHLRIFAENEDEVRRLEEDFLLFARDLAAQGIAVSAGKISTAIEKAKNNQFLKIQIKNFLRNA